MSSKILQKKGKLKEALDIGLAISNSVKTASTHHYVGLLYLNDSNVSEAFRYFHKAIECDPNHHPSLIELATIISETKPHQAIDILKYIINYLGTSSLRTRAISLLLHGWAKSTKLMKMTMKMRCWFIRRVFSTHHPTRTLSKSGTATLSWGQLSMPTSTTSRLCP